VLIRRRDVRLREKKIDPYKYPAIDRADEEEKEEREKRKNREKKKRQKGGKNRGDYKRISVIESFLLRN
jgi:hypothetical protein